MKSLIMRFFISVIVMLNSLPGIFSPAAIMLFPQNTAPAGKPVYKIEEDGIMSFDLFVSPYGNDANRGTIDAPLKTLSAAKEKLKKLINADVGNVHVWLREGEYHFTEPLSFTEKDLSDVTFSAYNGEKVVFTGAYELSGFTAEKANGVTVWTVKVPTGADFNTLSNGETLLARTRMPETGYYYVKNTDDSDVINEISEFFSSYVAFYAADGDIKSFRNTSDIVLRLLHRWKDEIATITGFDAASDKVALNRPTSMSIKNGDKYYLENVFEALNSPGEWYLDKTEGKLYYVPFEGDNINGLVLRACAEKTLITIDGTNNLSFCGITFTECGFPSPEADTIDFSQAGYDAVHCVTAVNSKGLSLLGCSFVNLGVGALKLCENVQDAIIEGCLFKNIGAQAVFICGENVAQDDPAMNKNIIIRDNHICEYGRNYLNSVGILLIHANSCTIENNEIHDGYYTAVSVGWVWGYGYSVTDNIKICNNLIYDIGQGWLSDMGGIYTLGIQPGTSISGNVIYNVAADSHEGGYGGWGIYLDEGSSYITVEKNLVYDCGSQCFHQHYGKENVLRNNIFALGRNGAFRITRKEEHISLIAEHNIFVSDNKPVIMSVEKGQITDNNNIFWDYTLGKEVVGSTQGDKADMLESWVLKPQMKLKGYFDNATFADPLFRDAVGFDFTLALNSPVFDTGFKAWNYSAAGTLSDYSERLNAD